MHTTTVSIVNPLDKSALKQFVALERKLMKNYPLFISEIDLDVTKLFNKKSLLFREMEFCLFVARKNGQDIARCAAIINKKFQKEKQPNAGFIGFFAAAEDCLSEVSEMFQQAENWLKERGVDKVIAPSNGGAPLSMGVLVTAFDENPMFPFPWYPKYYQSYIEKLDYEPTYPLWYYTIDFMSAKYQQAKKQYANYQNANIRPISKKNWDKDIETLTQLLNATFVEEWEFTTMTNDAMKEFFAPMKPILDAQQILFAEVNGKVAGFCFALPDLTPLFRTFNGNVGVIEIFKLLTKAKKFQRAGILGIGVLDEYKGKGIAKAIALKLYEYHESLGLKNSLYYPVNESNMTSRGFAESIGGEGRLMYQVYSKRLSHS